jgi:hypothetical protein
MIRYHGLRRLPVQIRRFCGAGPAHAEAACGIPTRVGVNRLPDAMASA